MKANNVNTGYITIFVLENGLGRCRGAIYNINNAIIIHKLCTSDPVSEAACARDYISRT